MSYPNLCRQIYLIYRLLVFFDIVQFFLALRERTLSDTDHENI